MSRSGIEPVPRPFSFYVLLSTVRRVIGACGSCAPSSFLGFNEVEVAWKFKAQQRASSATFHTLPLINTPPPPAHGVWNPDQGTGDLCLSALFLEKHRVSRLVAAKRRRSTGVGTVPAGGGVTKVSCWFMLQSNTRSGALCRARPFEHERKWSSFSLRGETPRISAV